MALDMTGINRASCNDSSIRSQQNHFSSSIRGSKWTVCCASISDYNCTFRSTDGSYDHSKKAINKGNNLDKINMVNYVLMYRIYSFHLILCCCFVPFGALNIALSNSLISTGDGSLSKIRKKDFN